MGPLSVSNCRGLFPWEGLLVIVSLLTFWCLPTNAQFSIVSTNVAVGEEVRLSLRNKPENAIAYRWFRGEREIYSHLIAAYFPLERRTEKGRFYEDRMILDMDGTLLIKKAAWRDRGMYTVVAYLPNEVKEIGFGWLDVYRPVKQRPIILASNYTVSENGNVVMSCESLALSIEWLFNGMALQLSERKMLSKSHRILIIHPVLVEDAGYYQCKVSDPFRSAVSWPLVLYVHPE